MCLLFPHGVCPWCLCSSSFYSYSCFYFLSWCPKDHMCTCMASSLTNHLARGFAHIPHACKTLSSPDRSEYGLGPAFKCHADFTFVQVFTSAGTSWNCLNRLLSQPGMCRKLTQSFYCPLISRTPWLNFWLVYHSTSYPTRTPPSCFPFLFSFEFATFIDNATEYKILPCAKSNQSPTATKLLIFTTSPVLVALPSQLTWGRRIGHPQARMQQTPLFLPGAQEFFMNRCFCICCLPMAFHRAVKWQFLTILSSFGFILGGGELLTFLHTGCPQCCSHFKNGNFYCLSYLLDTTFSMPTPHLTVYRLSACNQMVEQSCHVFCVTNK